MEGQHVSYSSTSVFTTLLNFMSLCIYNDVHNVKSCFHWFNGNNTIDRWIGGSDKVDPEGTDDFQRTKTEGCQVFMIYSIVKTKRNRRSL